MNKNTFSPVKEDYFAPISNRIQFRLRTTTANILEAVWFPLVNRPRISYRYGAVFSILLLLLLFLPARRNLVLVSVCLGRIPRVGVLAYRYWREWWTTPFRRSWTASWCPASRTQSPYTSWWEEIMWFFKNISAKSFDDGREGGVEAIKPFIWVTGILAMFFKLSFY